MYLHRISDRFPENRTIISISSATYDKGIRQTKADKMMIHKITPTLDYNKQLKLLDTNFNKPTVENLIKVSKVVKPKNKNNVKIQLWELVK